MSGASTISSWFHAARPKTLAAALVPVFLGSACAAVDGQFSLPPATLALLFALLIQICCNFANDYGDFTKGADTPARLGPARAVLSGWISPRAMRRAILLVSALAFLSGLPLVYWGGWWLLPVGIVCLLACLAYTGGPLPLAYNGLGDIFVIVFFGFVAVAFTAYVQCHYFPPSVWPVGLACGALATNILVVNNTRDYETDALAHKRTTVVLFGRGFSRAEYVANLLVAFAVPFWLRSLGFGQQVLFPLLLLPAALMLGRGFLRVRDPHDYNAYLGRTAAFLFAYGLLLGGGLLLSADL